MSTSLNLAGLQTEAYNPRSSKIDTVSTLELCKIVNSEDATIANVLQSCIPTIASTIDALAPRILQGGRLIYAGAGTSGRLGVLDASEIPPTYSAPPAQFVALIAGGDVALRSSREGAEDSLEGAVADLDSLNLDSRVDSLIGIATSGRTPYVLSSLAFAKSKGCVTVGIACASPSVMADCGNVDYMINAVTGPEVVTGSTRMKAGTATKLVLNMISTGVMIRSGKTFGNIMIDVKPTNVKLRFRARGILRQICGDRCPESDDDLDKILMDSGQSVKIAAIRIWHDVSVEEAQTRLTAADGILTNALNIRETNSDRNEGTLQSESEYVLCIDGGGSRCRAVIHNSIGFVADGEGGSCNLYAVASSPPLNTLTVDRSDIGVEGAISAMSEAVRQAAAAHPTTQGRSLKGLRWREVWVGLGGAARKPLTERLHIELNRLLGRQAQMTLSVTNDVDLLAIASGHRYGVVDLIVLVAGTGSIAIRYQWNGTHYVQSTRSGGWGALLGDDGSGFDIGRQAIRYALHQVERQDNMRRGGDGEEQADPLCDLIIDHYRTEDRSSERVDLLTSVLLSSSNSAQSMSSTRRRIASCARTVIEAASRSKQAQLIVDSAVRSLEDLVLSASAALPDNTDGTALILAGGVLQSQTMLQRLELALNRHDLRFMRMQYVAQPATIGARVLAQRTWKGHR